VTERAAFVRREAAKQSVVGTYSLTRNRGTVFLRHDGLDAWTLEEMFAFEVYALPAPVRRRLAALTDPVQVLDLGANIGLASLFFSGQLTNCCGIAYEPDPRSAQLLEQCLLANNMTQRWHVVRACAGTADGTVSFLAGQSAVSHIVDPTATEAIEVPVKDALEHLRDADLAKLDIEGAEWAVLSDARFPENPPAAMVIEYHAEFCPSDDPRAAMEHLLARAGYETLEVRFPSSAELPPGQGVMWGWQAA
jgi:FkbM family methyltransferase